MFKNFRATALIATLGALLVPSPAMSQTDWAKFPLTKAIPNDAFFALATRENPEQKFLANYWGNVAQSFVNSGFMDELWGIITDNVPEDKLDEVEDARDRLGNLLHQVAWGNLFKKEMILAARFHSPVKNRLGCEALLIGRLDKETASTNFDHLKAILKEIQALVSKQTDKDTLQVADIEINGVPVVVLHLNGDTPASLVALAKWQDLLLISFKGDGLLGDALSLLKNESKKPGLIESPRLKEAFAALPPAKDSLMFFDIEALLSPIRSILAVAGGSPKNHQPSTQPANTQSSEETHWLRVCGRILDEISFLDYQASVEWIDGHRVFSESITPLRSSTRNQPLTKLVIGSRPIEQWEKFIPIEATDFQCSSTLNLSKYYRYLLDFTRDHVPGGKEIIDNFEAKQKEWALDIEQDILRLLDGQMTKVTVDNSWAVLVQVSDADKAARQVFDLLERANTSLGEQSQGLLTETAIGEDKNFRQITHPMMFMLGGIGSLVIGGAEGHLIIGSSPDIVTKCLETGRGRHPNITKSGRWAKEALAPKSEPISAIRFTDESSFATQLQETLSSASMVLSMGAMFAQNIPRELHRFLNTVPPLLNKLLPVAGKMNFYLSSSEFTTFDGRQWRTRKVQNYKTPPPPSVSPTTTQESKEPAAAPAKSNRLKSNDVNVKTPTADTAHDKIIDKSQPRPNNP